jgi:hypothetical protein
MLGYAGPQIDSSINDSLERGIMAREEEFESYLAGMWSYTAEGDKKPTEFLMFHGRQMVRQRVGWGKKPTGERWSGGWHLEPDHRGASGVAIVFTILDYDKGYLEVPTNRFRYGCTDPWCCRDLHKGSGNSWPMGSGQR